MTRLLASVPLAVACGATASPATISNDHGPRRHTLRDLDWMNRTYDTAEPGLTPQPRRFTGGVYDNHLGADDAREVFRVAPPIYADVTGDGVDEALVELVRDQSVFEAPSLVHVIVVAGDLRRQTVVGFVYLGDCRLARARVVDGILEVHDAATGVDGKPCNNASRPARWRWTGTALVEVTASIQRATGHDTSSRLHSQRRRAVSY